MIHTVALPAAVQKKHKKDGDIIVVAVGTANGGVLALDSTGVIWKSACHTGSFLFTFRNKGVFLLLLAGMELYVNWILGLENPKTH